MPIANATETELEFDGERVVPGRTPPYLIWAHTARYRFSKRWAADRDVLDLGSGEGYGTFHLAGAARRACGIDIAEDGVRHAGRRYVADNLDYLHMDVQSLGFADESFDVATSFEVIEHLPDVRRYLDEIHRVLRPGGQFIVSTPNHDKVPEPGINPFHVKEYTVDEFQAMLSEVFDHVEIYGQFCRRKFRELLFMQSTRLYLKSRLYNRLINALGSFYFTGDRANVGSNEKGWVDRADRDSFTFERDHPERAMYLVAVCRKDG